MIFYTYKAQKEKTMELSKKREGGGRPALQAAGPLQSGHTSNI